MLALEALHGCIVSIRAPVKSAMAPAYLFVQ
jgi:hypothetical protein